jgi:hypothetical protein
LGESIHGIVGSDRWSISSQVSVRPCADAKAAAFCVNVLALIPAVRRFVVSEGIEPTNNHAERLLRRGVLWWNSAFGCTGATGCRFVKRLLTVVQTRR